MKKTMTMTTTLVLLALLLHAQAFAQKRTATLILSGVAAAGTGITLMALAFDYTSARCPAGASTYTVTVPSSYGGTTREDICVSTTSRGGSVYNAQDGGIPGTATYARPTYMKTGVALLAGGAVLMALPFLLPAKAQKVAPTVVITPTGIAASKTLTF